MRASFGLIVIVLFVTASTWADSSPILTASEVLALKLPDVRIEAAVHHDGSESSGGVRVAHLDVKGVIGGSIRFELLLPDEWNGRFAMGGGGGLVGSIQNVARGSINNGFATVGTDTGHQAGGTDGSWALDNLEALVNFGHVAVHRTAEVSKAIMREHYGKGPSKSYFLGCSRGGGQALMEAQRYPRDFDGIVAGAPAFDWPGVAALFVHIAQTMYPDPNNLTKTWLTPEDLDHIYAEIMTQVDEQDGLKDGIIDDPMAVTFDLSKVSGLTDAQRAAVQAVYDGVSNADGKVYPGFPIGAEAGRGGWFTWLVGPTPGTVSLSYAFGTNIFKYFVFNDPDWDYSTYDFSNWQADTRLAGSVLSSKDPNLDAFASRGGKLILWHGWADAALPAQATVAYYEEILQRDAKAMDYARLFMVPGCYHCGGGPGISQVNWLKVIIDWVEGGTAPDRVIASKPGRGDSPAMTRPLLPYPQRAEYKGTGDKHNASSFILRKQ
ncbi:MAG: tannase/feruloyl esterase family alpha/beta hydrolase [Phycisphaeraceae bacterium]|nr:tannase/feruloyl esterase family alpha/beta hydrolase [Phycisphaeraceae bacterium]